MATINNQDALKILRDSAKVQNIEPIPNQLADKIVGTWESNPMLSRRMNVLKQQTSVITGTETIYTTPTDKDFYLTYAQMAYAKDAVCNIASGAISISATPDGQAASSILRLSVITATAQHDNIVIELSHPIKLARNSGLNITGTFGAGVLVRNSVIGGYTVEN